MYNVRYFEYKNYTQFRLYSEPVLRKEPVEHVDLKSSYMRVDSDVIDMDSGEILWNESVWDENDDDFNDFESVPDNFEFEILESVYKEELKKKRDDSVRSSVGRTKRNIIYLSRSNEWHWFVTFTLNPEKVNRYDFIESSKKVRKFLNNLRRKVPDMVYLMVPELHKDGAWHFHGLMANVDGLHFVESGVLDDEGDMIYNMLEYNLGWSSCSKIRDTDKAANYIMKYITKALCEASKGRQRYWPSKNINRAKIYEAMLSGEEYKELLNKLYDKMTWKKKIYSEYQDVEIFEVPKGFWG